MTVRGQHYTTDGDGWLTRIEEWADRRPATALWEGPLPVSLTAATFAALWLAGLATMAEARWLFTWQAIAVTCLAVVIVEIVSDPDECGYSAGRTWAGRAVAWSSLTWTEIEIAHQWHRACELVGITNIPTIVRDGRRLAARIDQSSITLVVQVRPAREDKATVEAGEITLRKLDDLCGLGAHLKVALGGDVAEVDVHPHAGDRASVVITVDRRPDEQRRVRIATGEWITVVARRPNRAWEWHALARGWVLAAHRHATLHEHQGDDDDEWQDDEDSEPQPSPPLGPPRFAVEVADLVGEGCYSEGGGERAATPPWSPPTGQPISAGLFAPCDVSTSAP